MPVSHLTVIEQADWDFFWLQLDPTSETPSSSPLSLRHHRLLASFSRSVQAALRTILGFVHRLGSAVTSLGADPGRSGGHRTHACHVFG